MAAYSIVKLFFTSPLHISRGQTEEYDRSAAMLHSDTIAGALASAFAFLFPGVDVKTFMESFRVSSAFPFTHDLLFFPKPMAKLPVPVNFQDHKLPKKLKKVEFLEKQVFEKVLNNKEIKISDDCFIGSFMTEGKNDQLPFYVKEVQQRVMVPRDGAGDSLPYYIDRIWFKEGSGLFFLIDTGKQESILKACLRFLADTGVGTDKSVGNGQFRLSDSIIEDIEINVPKKAEKQVCLSLYCPLKEELNPTVLDGSSYNLEKRGGYMAGSSNDALRHLRKKQVFMFSCGSVFPQEKLEGKITEISPEWNAPGMHPVYRDGRGFFLPMVATI
jgi:CRISPR type III-A-associated RAMP protein Csm4